MRRPRGPGGRFLTTDEVAAMEKAEAEGKVYVIEDRRDPAKRKQSGGNGGPAAKKSKTQHVPNGVMKGELDDEEDEDEDGQDDE